ncbi:Multicopper oxidase, partial [hydrothermal vent metagenome]
MAENPGKNIFGFAMIVFFVIALAGCLHEDDSEEAFGLQVAEDINPHPDIVEINLEAREDYVEMIPGVPSKVYTYNGSVPGPLIRGNVGDTLIVHFT